MTSFHCVVAATCFSTGADVAAARTAHPDAAIAAALHLLRAFDVSAWPWAHRPRCGCGNVSPPCCTTPSARRRSMGCKVWQGMCPRMRRTLQVSRLTFRQKPSSRARRCGRCTRASDTGCILRLNAAAADQRPDRAGDGRLHRSRPAEGRACACPAGRAADRHPGWAGQLDAPDRQGHPGFYRVRGGLGGTRWRARGQRGAYIV